MAGKKTNITKSAKDKTDTEIPASQENAITTSDHFLDPAVVIGLHVSRYNKRIQGLIEIKDADDMTLQERSKIDAKRFQQLQEKKIRAYSDCINTMIQKEELLQFHNSGFEIEINDEETVTYKDGINGVDINKLTFDEQLELYELMKKAKKDVEELGAIKLNNVALEVNNNVNPELIEERPNVEFIKIETSPEQIVSTPVKAADPTVGRVSYDGL